jgi:transcription-repair coupling factor (superfamily II helicase)
MLSRFRSEQEQKKTLEELEAGKVDIVIGTHRLLSKDVKFQDLGLACRRRRAALWRDPQRAA